MLEAEPGFYHLGTNVKWNPLQNNPDGFYYFLTAEKTLVAGYLSRAKFSLDEIGKLQGLKRRIIDDNLEPIGPKADLWGLIERLNRLV